MPPGNYKGTPNKIYALVAGLEAGMIGGLVMLGWLALASLWKGRSIWSISNLMASTFHGELALRRGFRSTTLSGMALHLIVTAMLGIAFGLAVSGIAQRRRVMFLGLFAGVAWYYIGFEIFWKILNPLVPLYSPHSAMLVAHVMLGIFLGSFPRYAQALEP